MNARLARFVELARGFDPSPRTRRLLRLIGYPAFALFVAIVTLLASVPQDRVKDRLETALSADVGNPNEPLALGMDVSIGDLSLTLLSGFGFKGENVILRSRPLNIADKPTRYVVDDVRLRIGLLGLLFNHPSYRFKGHALQGMVAGVIDNSVDQTHANVELEKLSLGSVPGLPLPIEGVLGSKLDLDVPKNLLANASGNLELTLDDAAIGDGKAKLTVPNDPFLAQGLTIPRVRLGKLTGTIVIEKGRARFENVRAHSADADATLEGYVELHDPIGLSQVHAYLKFRAAEALTKKEPTIDLLVNSMAMTARRSDGYLGVQITGPLMALAYVPSKDPPFGVTSRNEPPPPVAPAPPTGASPPAAAVTPPANEPAPVPPPLPTGATTAPPLPPPPSPPAGANGPTGTSGPTGATPPATPSGPVMPSGGIAPTATPPGAVAPTGTSPSGAAPATPVTPPNAVPPAATTREQAREGLHDVRDPGERPSREHDREEPRPGRGEPEPQ